MPMTASRSSGARTVGRPCRATTRRTSAARSREGGRRGARRSSAPVRSPAAIRSSSRRFHDHQLARAPRRRIGAAARRPCSIVRAPRSVGEQPRQAAARGQHGDERLGQRDRRRARDQSGCVDEALEGAAAPGRGRPTARRARRSRCSWQMRCEQLDVGVAPLAVSRVAVRRRRDVPISTAPTRHHSTSASRSTASPSATSCQSPGRRACGRIGGRQRIGLGDEAGAVVGGVADHRLRVDGEPRLALGGQHVRGVQVAVQQDRMRAGVGPVRIVSSAAGQARVGPGVAASRRPSTSSAHGAQHRPPAWGDPRAAAPRGGARRSPRPARDGLERAALVAEAVPGPAALDQQRRAVADRDRTGGRLRHRPTPGAPTASGADSGCGSWTLSTASSPSDRRRAGRHPGDVAAGLERSVRPRGPTRSATSATSAGAARATSRPTSPSHATDGGGELRRDDEIPHAASLPDRLAS